jgi:hypothetical protein
VNRLRCQRENGRRSRRPTSSADFSALPGMSSPRFSLLLVAALAAGERRGYAPRAELIAKPKY